MHKRYKRRIYSAFHRNGGRPIGKSKTKNRALCAASTQKEARCASFHQLYVLSALADGAVDIAGCGIRILIPALGTCR